MFSKSYRRVAVVFILVFIAMYVFRIIYGYCYKGRQYDQSGGNSFLSDVVKHRKNYASEKIKPFDPANAGSTSIAGSQKYEKVANVRSKSTHFTEDEKLLHSIIKKFDAIIQYQQESGNKGAREIQMLIGVSPEKFDSFYLATQGIGVIKSTEITKTDKTNEYRKLNATKVSLEKSLASFNDLKAKEGKIEDFIALHNKIYEVETELQGLGVELGNFDTENEFCTVQFSMYEGAADKPISFVTRLKVALEWTIKYYGVLVAGVFFAAAAAWVILKLIVLANTFIASQKKV
ncbi:uncharacterized protein DUF4349 [Chitinophaga polysaccharea]|uniref:Uncharacterized protein DUF4349 n=1 Tax=Chitinophaga polysaccharea TaxID=1293035 RepID=A0A561Q503_9BACT|nr:DUF4349 domain-containing protein [Chitinophaga polysaccharea]TWF45454.1 uncharacterized protein DUF4349 [Chitinophaga polysaccharea]